MLPLRDRIAVVAGATRGAGRGIACMLGEAGAVVYCTGRSVTGSPPAAGHYRGRRETIEETAALVTARGGIGIAVRTDHARPDDVAALTAEIDRAHGRLDIVVMDFWGDESPVPFGTPFWEIALPAAQATIEATLWPHVRTLQALVPLLRRHRPRADRSRGLVVEVMDGPGLYYRTSLFFDLAATLRSRLAYAVAEELAPHGITAVGVSPGYLRSELTLERLGVTEANWRDAIPADANFAASETPSFLGRGIAALAADADSARLAGGVYGSWDLAREYGVTDIDGSRPDFGRQLALMYGESPAPRNTPARWAIVMDASTRTAGSTV
jgi:NAD(P)-dependent dehydrogenase (short-subunit alcohol dehydrogenase family)